MKNWVFGFILTVFVLTSSPIFPSAWMIPEGQISTSMALTLGQVSGFFVGKSRVQLTDIPGFSASSISVSSFHYQGAWGWSPQNEIDWSTGIVSQASFPYIGATMPGRTYLADTRVSIKHQFFSGLASGATEFGIGIPGTYPNDSFSFEGSRDFEFFVGIMIAHQSLDGFSTSLDFGHYWRLGEVPNAFHMNYYVGQTFLEDWRVFGSFDYWLDLEGNEITTDSVYQLKNGYYQTREIQDRITFGLERSFGEWTWGAQYMSVMSGENTPQSTAFSIYTSTAQFL